MTAPRRRRSDHVQPELPLGRHGTAHRARDDRGHQTRDDPGRRARASQEWKLDEPTRRIGLQGVAQARALLGRPTRGDGPGQPGDGRGPSGRAA